MATSPSTSTAPSVARRVTLLSISLLAGVLFAISIVIGLVAERSTREQIVSTVKEKIQGVAGAVESSDVTNRELIQLAFKFFRQYFEPNMELNEATGELKSHAYPVNNDFVSVDKFTEDTGGVATVFARKGEDFIRVTTSLKKQDGSRAMGTLLDRNHPAYKLMLAGKVYSGPAVLFGKPYMTHYEPMKDTAGKVNAILFIGYDITPFQAVVEKHVTEQRFFATGGTYVIDPRSGPAEALFVIHPTAKGKKVLDAFPQAEPFLKMLAASPGGLVADAPAIFHVDSASKWAVLQKSKVNGWWIVGEVSDAEAMAQHWQGMAVTWGLLALATVLMGLGLFVLIRRSVTRPLAELRSVVMAVASGDLTKSVQTGRHDEIGELMQEVEGLRLRYLQIMSQVRSAVDSISTASSEIASGNQDLSNRTEQTASNLQQTAHSMAQLTTTVQHSADSARQANQLAASAAEVAARGGSVVSQVVSTMDDINHSSRKISDIISVIDGIAFQTNILALNAAVEAARAGEQGRGFAVVATEVRSLAQRSAEAAKEIKNLIGTSVEKVQSGSRLVQDAGSTMGEIVSSVQRVSDIIGEITAAASEQSAGIGQVNSAIGQLDQMTQQNAALVEQSAAAAQSLRDQAERLSQGVQIFKLGDGSKLSASYDPSQRLAQPEAVGLSHSGAATPRLGMGVGSSTDDIDLDSAIEAHAQWRTTLRAAAEKHEKLDAKTISRDDCCVLGKWLHGKGKSQYGSRPIFVDLVLRHSEFHSAAGKVAQTINRGEYQAGKDMLAGNTEFSRTSSGVGGAIMQMRREMTGGTLGKALPTPRSAAPAPKRPALGKSSFKPSPAPKAAPKPAAASSSEGDWEAF